MKEIWRGLFLSNRFFASGSIAVFLFAMSFGFSWLFYAAQVFWWGLVGLTAFEVYQLFIKTPKLKAVRKMPERMSLGDKNKVTITFENTGQTPLPLTVVDELPAQFQKRDFSFPVYLERNQETTAYYPLRPVSRGTYHFGQLHAFLQGQFCLTERRFTFPIEDEVSVYPSVLQMKKYELIASSKLAQAYGVRKLRRIGHSYEFEQIKNYVQGDDYRSINWKATSRRSQLMINQFQEEKSQQIYAILDKSRSMRMPFHDLTLLDYAINASLVITNLALRKQDKAGLLTFSDRLGPRVLASRKKGQIRRILETLYRQKTEFPEANFELLYQVIRRQLNGRSLLLLFTNCESISALERNLPILRRINKLHLLVVIVFENSEIQEFIEQPAEEMEEIYTQTIAQKLVSEKEKMSLLMSQYGIQNILTTPEDLSMDTVNKYLELKSRGLI